MPSTHPAGRASHRDTTRPPATRTRRGDTRRPYPTAPTTSHTSPSRASRAGTHRRARATTPIPATVWTAGPAPIDPAAMWPLPIIEKIITSFSQPGERVVIVPWPTSTTPDSGQVVDGNGVIDGNSTATPPDSEDMTGDVSTVLATIRRLDRTGHRLPLAPGTGSITEAGSRPFWAALFDTGAAAPTPVAADSPPGTYPPDRAHGEATDSADLVITSLPVGHPVDPATDATRDHVAGVAARVLRTGGILAVLTHCDWSSGELIDPTGPMIAAAQNADLLYLQHIVALHTPIRDGTLAPPPADPDTATRADPGGSRDRSTRPVPHRRVHADVLVFAAHAAPASPTTAVLDHGVVE